MKVQVCDFSNKLTKEQERKIKTKRRLSLGAESRALGFVGGFFVFVFGFFLFCFVLFFWPHCSAYGILLLQARMEPTPPAGEVRILNH